MPVDPTPTTLCVALDELVLDLPSVWSVQNEIPSWGVSRSWRFELKSDSWSSSAFKFGATSTGTLLIN